MPEEFPQDITAPLQITFPIDNFGLYILKVVARCKSGGILSFRGGQDLQAEIDGIKFREIPPISKPQHENIPPAWNGTKLKGLAKTVFFILPLDKGSHILKLIPRKGAKIQSFELIPAEDHKSVSFTINEQAEEGNCRPWYTFALINLPVRSITADATIDWHIFDGDDIKLIVDNEIETNKSSKRWKDWVWHAKPGQFFSGSKREEKVFTKNLSTGTHYIELWADKTPTLHKVTLECGEFELNRTPTVDNPEWTGAFNDDTEAMILARLIFGEARNQTKSTMIGIGWVVKNRLLAKRPYFGFSYHEIITKHNGTNYQFFPLNPEDKTNLPLLIDPLKNSDNATRQAWFNSYGIALSIVNGTSNDPTDGSTFFHSSDLSQEVFTEEIVPGAIFVKQIGDFLFYKDPSDI